MSFPISLSNYREYDADFDGEVFVCDIDRTYLATRLSSWKGMARVPFEFAVDKRAIDGMTTLLREVRRGPDETSRQTPLYFVSASPAQLRPVIERKMLLDGLEFDGLTFKDWFGVVRSLRLARFREQIGFKLTALLLLRAQLPSGVRQTFIGDDIESDATIFTLFADVVSRRLAGDALARVLVEHGVADDDAADVVELAGRIPAAEHGVRRAYIRLERHPDGEALRELCPGVVPCSGALQMACSLYCDGSITLEGVRRVGRELIKRQYSREEIGAQLGDAVRRAIVRDEQADELRAALYEAALIRDEPLPTVDPIWREAMTREVSFWTASQR